MSEGPTLQALLDLLRPDRYRLTVYVGPDIDKAWLESQVPIDVEVVTSKYLTPGTAIVMPTRKQFDLPSVPPTTTTVGETEEPDDEDDTGNDQQQGGHGDTETDEQDNEQKDQQQDEHD